MDPIIYILIAIGIGLFIAYRHGKLTGINSVLQAKAPAIEVQAQSFFGGLFKKAAAAAPQPVTQATPPAPVAVPAAPAPTPVATAASNAANVALLSALVDAQKQLATLRGATVNTPVTTPVTNAELWQGQPRDDAFIYPDEPGYADAASKITTGGPGGVYYQPGNPISRQNVGLPRKDKGNVNWKEGDHALNATIPTAAQKALLDIATNSALSEADRLQANQAIYATLGFAGADGSTGTPANTAYSRLMAGYVNG
jgi:hypothetical protein